MLRIALLLMIATSAASANPKDFPLTATVLSSQSSGKYLLPTGNDREEIQIGNKVYITQLWSRGNLDTDAGVSFPAALAVVGHRAFNRVNGIRLLVSEYGKKSHVIS